jgi:hypothetical protein
MGFPDVQWETYFVEETPDDAKSNDEHRRELEMMISQLRKVSSEAAS